MSNPKQFAEMLQQFKGNADGAQPGRGLNSASRAIPHWAVKGLIRLFHIEAQHRVTYYASHRGRLNVCAAIHPLLPHPARPIRHMLHPAQCLSLLYVRVTISKAFLQIYSGEREREMTKVTMRCYEKFKCV